MKKIFFILFYFFLMTNIWATGEKQENLLLNVNLQEVINGKTKHAVNNVASIAANDHAWKILARIDSKEKMIILAKVSKTYRKTAKVSFLIIHMMSNKDLILEPVAKVAYNKEMKIDLNEKDFQGQLIVNLSKNG